ncbi:hypothetical protein [Mycolicibacterium brisbanense]|uniref:Uncharacterized protein n=1 Tax=Mycolicibacterium brisbanense TaxID=146020 RepID=A0A100W6W3_9MYCO|nr:hypothetical protein [Mycolicibacterium brisbanense]MCV7158002.1 hypothetical protein [Mycolicibacterium brisbanense]GAS92649.1 uncharacterized protein, precursor [Mycolicibacterium brisbanense]
MSDNDSTEQGTIAAAELGRIIDDAALFACRDSTLPMLNAIRLESTPKNLIAVATDRFTIGASMADYSGPGPEFQLLLELPRAQMVSKLAKSCKAVFSEVTITATDDKVTFGFTGGESLTVPRLNGYQFPDWRKYVTGHSNGEGDSASPRTIGVNPSYLARLGRVHNARQMVMKTTAPTKPILVSVGTSFIGVIMPVRIDTETPPLWESSRWFPKPEPEVDPTPESAIVSTVNRLVVPTEAAKPAKRAPVKRTTARKPRKTAARQAVPA